MRPGPQPRGGQAGDHWLLRLRNNRGQSEAAARNVKTGARPTVTTSWPGSGCRRCSRNSSGQLAAVPGAVALEKQRPGLGPPAGIEGCCPACCWWVRRRGYSRDLTGWQRWTSDLATATGERRSVRLPDGTRLHSDTDSAVDLRLQPAAALDHAGTWRVLVTCGAVGRRPLLVQTRHGLFEGIDGRFAVRQDSACTRLSVVSGNVAIHSPHGAKGLFDSGARRRKLPACVRTQATLAAPLDMDIGAWADG